MNITLFLNNNKNIVTFSKITFEIMYIIINKLIMNITHIFIIKKEIQLLLNYWNGNMY